MKVYILDYGRLGVPLAWEYTGTGFEQRVTPMYGVLIVHPKDGLIIYDVGPSPEYQKHWPKSVLDLFPVLEYKNENRIDTQLAKLGYRLDDVSAIIISHGHLDHAGGLEFFRGKDIPIYIHEEELKHLLIAVKEDYGAYLPHYIDPSFNWKRVSGDEVELFDNIILYHVPGHTPGTMAMLVTGLKERNLLFVSDHAAFKDNWEKDTPLGFGMRDWYAWRKSQAKMKIIAKKYNAQVALGHEMDYFNALKHLPAYYE